MPETETEEVVEPDPKPKGLEDLISELDEESRKVILGEVGKARKEAADYRTKLREAEPLAKRAKQLEDAQKTAEDKANEKTAWAEAKAVGYRDRAVKAEVKALAAPQFADPEDASAFLNLGDYVDDDGDIDTSAIKADLGSLLERKPHLARVDNNPRAPRPDTSQGSGGNRRESTPGEQFASWLKTAEIH